MNPEQLWLWALSESDHRKKREKEEEIKTDLDTDTKREWKGADNQYPGEGCQDPSAETDTSFRFTSCQGDGEKCKQ